MSGGKIKGSLRNAADVIKSSNDPRRTYDPRKVWEDSRRATGNELGNWSPSTFGGMSENIQQQQAQEAAAAEAAAHQRAVDMAAQMFGPGYQGGQVTGGGGSGMMASPMIVTPQQQWNMGLPGLQNQGQASRQDIAALLGQMRQNPAMGGFNPLMPRTVMPQPPGPQRPPLQGDGPPVLGGLGGGSMTAQQMSPPEMYPQFPQGPQGMQFPQGPQYPQINPDLWQRPNLGMWR